MELTSGEFRLRIAAAGAARIAALSLPSAGWAQNITEGALKLGILNHDVSFLGGREPGIDINPEVILPSPIPDFVGGRNAVVHTLRDAAAADGSAV